MIDLDQHSSLGSALREALDAFANETCLIEADRDRERTRLTYSDFKQMALPLARALQDAEFQPNDRCAIVMTNQSKWLISAYGVLYAGGVLVPLDYKLTAGEHLPLLAHSKAKFLIIEYHLWRAITEHPEFSNHKLKIALVTEAPPTADLRGGFRWEEFRRKGDPTFIPRKREDWACIVYSSGTGGRPKGCVLTHNNYLEQCKSLSAWYPFWPGVRYLSILPTNHAIDFMVGFIGPFVCGACVVHLRTLRPEFVRDAFVRYKITYVSLVPLVLKNLERGIRGNFENLSVFKRFILDRMIAINKVLTRSRPNVPLSRKLLPQVHKAFGGELLALITGGAFIEPSTLQFFYDLGIPVANGYGLTEGCTALTLNDLKPFRADTVGKALPGVEIRILSPDADGVGEVAAKSATVMSHYLDDPELTAETIVDGWLLTGDLGRFELSNHLQLLGRKKNMIVTEGGKNIYPEDIESAFEGIDIKEHSIFAANFIWSQKELGKETLVLVLHPDLNQEVTRAVIDDIVERNRRLPDFKRVGGYLVWDKDFPRTASMKIKRTELAEQIRQSRGRSAIKAL
ncbi:MAG TPA: AMP-binding protein [Terriglobales bacterium]|jgi:long-chain acyl-CoA synthetase|nr:AMP-binding protein [Terriglobales bacterium]